jgi:hypothetical protein
MERSRKLSPGSFRGFICFIAVLAGLAMTPFALIAGAFWMASDDWKFEGGGVRYWLFVKGSRLERLGLVAPTDRLAQYTIALQEGTFPGWNIVTYASTAMPAEIAATYADRCRSMGFRITKPPTTDPSAAEASLTCEIVLYLDVEVFAERTPSTAFTDVSLRVWGSD